MKSYVISISAGKGCYRHIQIAASATLLSLHKAIINAFDFDDDHEHAFFMDNQHWGAGAAYFSTKVHGDERLTKRYKLEYFGLQKGTAFKYLFDYGDEWLFQCKVLREVQEETKNPKVIRCVGESPEQYPDCDDDWDDDWDDDEEMPIPPEVLKEIYDSIPLEDEVIQNIRDYFDAACRLYGIIRLDKLYEIYVAQNPPVSRENFFLVAALAAQKQEQYLIDSCGEVSEYDIAGNLEVLEVTAEYLYYENDDKDRARLRRLQADKPFKILPKETFLGYGEPDGHPAIPENQALLEFIRRKKNRLQQSPETLCHAMQTLLMIDLSIAEIIVAMTDFGLQVSPKTELPELVELLEKLEKVTPKHKHRGHTPNEMEQLRPKTKQELEREPMAGQASLFDREDPPQQPVLTLLGTPPKNAPCPCGSGRRYKNCCGKLPCT